MNVQFHILDFLLNIATSFIQENSVFVTDHSMMLDVVDYMCIKKQSECLDVMN